MREQTIRGSARNSILRAAIDVIAGHGLDALTHRRVAEAAGVSPGSITHHFASREELVREAFRFHAEHAFAFLASIEEELRVSVADPLERVRQFATEIVRREFVHPGEHIIRAEHEMLVFASTDAELASVVRGWDARLIGAFAPDLEAAGWSRPVEVARTLINLIRGFEIERFLHPGVDADDFRRRLDVVLVADAGGGVATVSQRR